MTSCHSTTASCPEQIEQITTQIVSISTTVCPLTVSTAIDTYSPLSSSIQTNNLALPSVVSSVLHLTSISANNHQFSSLVASKSTPTRHTTVHSSTGKKIMPKVRARFLLGSPHHLYLVPLDGVIEQTILPIQNFPEFRVSAPPR